MSEIDTILKNADKIGAAAAGLAALATGIAKLAESFRADPAKEITQDEIDAEWAKAEAERQKFGQGL